MSAALAIAVALCTAQAPVPHRLHVSLGAGASGYLSDTRTMGGVGGSVGVEDVVRDFVLLEGDASYLFMIGNVVSLRAGAGVQWPGIYSPAVTLGLTALLGDRFSFFQPGVPVPGNTPTLALDLTLAPIRFATANATVTVLAVGVGLGTELPGFGRFVRLQLLQIAIPLG